MPDDNDDSPAKGPGSLGRCASAVSGGVIYSYLTLVAHANPWASVALAILLTRTIKITG